jgi:glutamyl-Q tRNA(Asp) synthetase
LYIGRFAPTPSGPLHFGSIITAIASYLDAKQNNGKWKVRIDDIDSPRIIEGADSLILKNLESLGLFWDDKISRQSENLQEYKNVLEMLKSKNLTYNCNCSRKQIALSNQSDFNEPIYNNHCRFMQHPLSNKSAIRLITDYKSTQFIDRTQGTQHNDIDNSIGDFIIKRSDQIYSYQLAVVIDDQLQSVTNIVRGADLLNSTIKQYYINKLLNFPEKTYMHIPIATINNRKLSKGNGDKVNNNNFSLILIEGLKFLKQKIEKDIEDASPREIIKYAVKNWDTVPLQKIKDIELNSSQRLIADSTHT